MMVDLHEVRDLGGAESEELQDVGAGARYELAPALGASSASSSSLAPPAARPLKPEQTEQMTLRRGFRPNSSPDTFKTELCPRFTYGRGGCRYGARCKFAHGLEDLRPRELSNLASASSSELWTASEGGASALLSHY